MKNWFDVVEDTQEEETEDTEETTTESGDNVINFNNEVKPKRTRRPRDPNKPKIPSVSKEVAIEIVKLWKDHSRDEIATKLNIMPEQVTKTVQQLRASYKKKMEEAKESGNTVLASKLESILTNLLVNKPKGRVGGPGVSRKSIADEVLEDLLGEL